LDGAGPGSRACSILTGGTYGCLCDRHIAVRQISGGLAWRGWASPQHNPGGSRRVGQLPSSDFRPRKIQIARFRSPTRPMRAENVGRRGLGCSAGAGERVFTAQARIEASTMHGFSGPLRPAFYEGVVGVGGGGVGGGGMVSTMRRSVCAGAQALGELGRASTARAKNRIISMCRSGESPSGSCWGCGVPCSSEHR